MQAGSFAAEAFANASVANGPEIRVSPVAAAFLLTIMQSSVAEEGAGTGFKTFHSAKAGAVRAAVIAPARISLRYMDVTFLDSGVGISRLTSRKAEPEMKEAYLSKRASFGSINRREAWRVPAFSRSRGLNFVHLRSRRKHAS
jgi:hypothetical protein